MTSGTNHSRPDPVLSDALIADLRAAAVDVHTRHRDHGNSLLDPGMPVDRRLAALIERIGTVARLLTNDDIDDVERQRQSYRELVNVGTVALTWAEFIKRST